MGKLSGHELLSRVFDMFTFDEIIDFGLERGDISSEDIINAASEYSDPNKEYSDDEIKDIVKDADISVVMEALNEKYLPDDIIDELDTDEILNAIGWDDVYDYFEFDFKDKEQEKYNEGYEDGHDDAFDELKDDMIITEKDCINMLKEYNINNLWCFFANLFEITYYDKDNMIKKLDELKNKLHKSIYYNI